MTASAADEVERIGARCPADPSPAAPSGPILVKEPAAPAVSVGVRRD
jgi:hypothetical protein